MCLWLVVVKVRLYKVWVIIFIVVLNFIVRFVKGILLLMVLGMVIIC